MNTSPWAAVGFIVLGAFLSAAFPLAAEWIRRHWLREEAKIERRLVRSEQAAREVLTLVGEIERRLRQSGSDRQVPDQREMQVMARPLRDASLLVGDHDVRVRLDAIATVAEQLHSVEVTCGYEPHRIAAAVSATARNAVAHVLSGESLSDPSPIGEYLDGVEEHWRWMEEAEADNAAQHQRRR